MSYISVADFRLYGDISSESDDALLENCISRAQAMINAYTQRVFESDANSSRTFDAVKDVDGSWLFLDQDLCSLNTVTNGDGTAISTSVIVKEPRNTTPWFALKIRSDQNISWTYTDYPENAITVSGKWAYSTEAPDDIVQATIRLANFIYRQRESHEDLDRPLLTNDGVTILPSQMPHDVRQILEPYVRIVPL